VPAAEVSRPGHAEVQAHIERQPLAQLRHVPLFQHLVPAILGRGAGEAGLAESKIIFIKAVLCCAEKFVGDVADTSATYTTKQETK